MRVPASTIERVLRAVLAEAGAGDADPLSVESPGQTSDLLLGEDRDASGGEGVLVFIVPPETPGELDEYLLHPGPDGNAEAADVDQDLRTIRRGNVADAVWERLAVELGVTVGELLAYD